MRSYQFLPGRQPQRGQTLVWFLATVAACCCAFVLVYNVGQVANQKEATVNAADAAALSGALVEARMLNFEAYTNRAMIANEVTIAQLVSLDSWVQYDSTLLDSIAEYTAIIPYVDELTQPLAATVSDASAVVDSTVSGLVPSIEEVNTALLRAREVANGVGVQAANDVATQIAGANETTFGGRYDEQPQLAQMMLNVNYNFWTFFTDSYAGNGRANAKAVILDSRDPFSTYRSEGTLIDVLNGLLESAGLGATAGTAYTGFEKTSGATTLQDYDHWEAQDSLDVTSSTLKLCAGFIPCGYQTSIAPPPIDGPLGYGRADADSGGSGSNLCNLNPATLNCTLAMDDANPPIPWAGTGPSDDGIPNIRDLAQGLATTDPCSTNNVSDSPSLSFMVWTSKPGQAALTTQRLGMNTVDVPGPQGSPQMTDDLASGGALSSVSTACTFFLRPDLNQRDITEGELARSDGVHEYASLYNPYWQARLSPNSPAFKALLQATWGTTVMF